MYTFLWKMFASKTPSIFVLLMLHRHRPNLVHGAPTHQITCSAEPCQFGKSASVTFSFLTDISESKRDFYVTHFNSNEKSVLLCNWLPDGTVSCISRDGFTLHDNHAGTSITLDIQDFQPDKQGLYMCHVIGVPEEAVRGCNLTVANPEQTTMIGSESSGPEAFPIEARVVLYALLLLGVACVLVIIAIRLTKKRQSEGESGDQGNAKPPLLQNHTETEHSYPLDSNEGMNNRAERNRDVFSTRGWRSVSTHTNLPTRSRGLERHPHGPPKQVKGDKSEEHSDDIDDPKQIDLTMRLQSLRQSFPDLKSEEDEDETKREKSHKFFSGSQHSHSNSKTRPSSHDDTTYSRNIDGNKIDSSKNAVPANDGRKINSSDYRMPSVPPAVKMFQAMVDTRIVEERRRQAQAKNIKTNRESEPADKDKETFSKKKD